VRRPPLGGQQSRWCKSFGRWLVLRSFEPPTLDMVRAWGEWAHGVHNSRFHTSSEFAWLLGASSALPGLLTGPARRIAGGYVAGRPCHAGKAFPHPLAKPLPQSCQALAVSLPLGGLSQLRRSAGLVTNGFAVFKVPKRPVRVKEDRSTEYPSDGPGSSAASAHEQAPADLMQVATNI
jgi:hypothetical protein